MAEDWLFTTFRLPLAKLLREQGVQVGVGCRVREHRKLIEEAGVEVIDVPFARESLAPIEVLRACKAVRGLVRTWQPDLVHAVALRPVVIVWLATIGQDRPVMLNAITGLGSLFAGGVTSLRLRTARMVVRASLRRALCHSRAWSVFQNQEDLRTFVKQGSCPVRRCRLIRGSGVDTRWEVQPEPKAGAPVVLFVGRLLRDKGIREVVEASQLLHRTGVEHRLRIVGEPDPCNPSSVTEEERSAWGQHPWIEMVGYRTDVMRQMSEAHVVVLPSYREGLPKVLLEAGVAGRAVVATDVVGCRELVQHEENGLLVPARDADQLAAAIRRVLRDPGLRRKLAARHRQVVLRDYGMDLINREYLMVYAEAMGCSRGRHELAT